MLVTVDLIGIQIGGIAHLTKTKEFGQFDPIGPYRLGRHPRHFSRQCHKSGVICAFAANGDAPRIFGFVRR
jgi:hypothetical protein